LSVDRISFTEQEVAKTMPGGILVQIRHVLIFSRLHWEPEVPYLLQAFGHANVTLAAQIANYLMMNNFLRTG
jgi:hypothetical protein